MALEPHQQFVEAVKRSRSVAVVFRVDWNGDSLGTALALAGFIESFGIPAEVMSQGFAPHPHYTFLSGVPRVRPMLAAGRQLLVKLKLDACDDCELTHEVRDGHLHLLITPRSGAVAPQPAAVVPQPWKHDLIVTVDAPELDALGALYRGHREFFAGTPIVNIDHDPGNERYGAVNLVDLRATSCAEIVAELIEAADPRRLDAETATALLTGLIAKTRSFRTPNVSPRTLALAGRLIAAGARRAEIVERLFRTRSIASLRLWGRVLARLKADRERKLVWSLLARTDFIHAGADPAHLPDVIDELIGNAPEAEVVCILHEHPSEPNVICGIVSAERARDAHDLAAPWQGEGSHRLARFEIKNTALSTAERDVIEHLRSRMTAR